MRDWFQNPLWIQKSVSLLYLCSASVDSVDLTNLRSCSAICIYWKTFSCKWTCAPNHVVQGSAVLFSQPFLAHWRWYAWIHFGLLEFIVTFEFDLKLGNWAKEIQGYLFQLTLTTFLWIILRRENNTKFRGRKTEFECKQRH